MAYISNPNNFLFNDEILRGFVIEELNDEEKIKFIMLIQKESLLITLPKN